MRRTRTGIVLISLLAALATALLLGCQQPGSQTVALNIEGFPRMLRPRDVIRVFPEYGAILDAAPLFVTVETSQAMGQDSEITVYRNNRRVDNRDGSVMIGSDKKLQVSLKTPQGKGIYRVEYTIRWRSGSASEGRFYFRVTSAQLD